MTDHSKHVVEHYTATDLEPSILDALLAVGRNIDQLTVDDLAPFDAFHLRGRQATAELATLAELQSGQRLLDIGSGIGGTSRYLAATFDCDVIGIDLTPDFCRIAEKLTQRTGLADRVTFQCGSALELPFDDATFDVVWTEHAQMNIADKQAFYREATRVLKPQGQFVFHDILAGSGSDLVFPVPWAPDASISHLIAVDELWMLLTELGYDIATWEDVSEPARAFVAEMLEKMNTTDPQSPRVRPPMEDGKTKLTNLLENLNHDRVRVVQAATRKLA